MGAYLELGRSSLIQFAGEFPMYRVVHIEIHDKQPERAIAFYRKVFGWQFTPWDGGEQVY